RHRFPDGGPGSPPVRAARLAEAARGCAGEDLSRQCKKTAEAVIENTMSIIESQRTCVHPGEVAASPAPFDLPQPPALVAPTGLVKLCYTLVHAAEAVGIRDLA